MTFSALDWLNFFLADVRGGLGPYVNVLLVTDAHWSQFAVGSTLMVSGLIGVAAHPMVGAFIDRTHAKREAIILGAFLLAACALALVTWPILPVVLIADVIMAVLGGLFAPSIAAITLGLFGHEALAARLGRNAAFDKGGNIFIALLAGVIGFAVSQKAPFYLVPLFAVLTTAAALSIPAGAIDHARARGLEPSANHDEHPASWRTLLHDRPLVVFAGSAAIFYFADAPMLPLVAQKLALAHPGYETGLTSVSIILAQLVTILMALLVTRANAIGRRPLLIAAFVSLVMRALLCVGYSDTAALLLSQGLEGVTGGTLRGLAATHSRGCDGGDGPLQPRARRGGDGAGNRRLLQPGRGRLPRLADGLPCRLSCFGAHCGSWPCSGGLPLAGDDARHAQEDRATRGLARSGTRRSIIDRDQIKAVRGRDLPAARAVARVERAARFFYRPFAAAHMLKRAHQRPHLMM